MKHNFGLKILRNTQVSPSLRIPQGVQVLLLGLFGKSRTSIRSLRLSHPSIPVLALALVLLGPAFFSHSAYAAFSASISRTSSEAVTLSDGGGSGAIKPSYTGTLGTGSDVVTVSSNCSAGYNLYVSAISGGSTNLSISGGTDYIPSTTTATGSETALTKDTWGIGKDGVTFSKLPDYTTDIGSLIPLYTNTGNEGSNGNDGDSSGRDSGNSNSSSQDYTIYYGINVSTAKTPGTYTGDVLYTVLMNSACLEYTLKFDDNGATTSNLPNGTSGNEYPVIPFGQAVDLSEYSTTEKISKTGYHLTGWQDQDGNSYGITETVDINPNDKSTVTLTAMWEANTYTIKYAAGSTGGSCSVSDTAATYDQNVTLSSTKCAKSGAEQKGWSTNQSGSPKAYDLGETLEKPNLTAEDKGTFPLYPYFESAFGEDTLQGWTGCSSLTVGTYLTLKDARDNNPYVVKKLPDNKCWMVENLRLVNYKLTSSDSDVTSDFTLPTSSLSGWCINNTAECIDVARVYYESSRYSIGALYNWYAITAGTGTFAMTSGNAPSSICPKGWRLPIGGTNASTNDFSILDRAYGGSGGDRIGANTWSSLTGTYTSGNNANFTMSGYIYNSSIGDVGYRGDPWTSTAVNSFNAFMMILHARDGTVRPMGDGAGGGKWLGFPMRCIFSS